MADSASVKTNSSVRQMT